MRKLEAVRLIDTAEQTVKFAKESRQFLDGLNSEQFMEWFRDAYIVIERRTRKEYDSLLQSA